MSNSPTTLVPDDDELKESIAQLITGGVFYYELTDSFMNDSVLGPQFPARWPSDVAQGVDKLAEFIKSYGDRRELGGRLSEWSHIYADGDDASRIIYHDERDGKYTELLESERIAELQSQKENL